MYSTVIASSQNYLHLRDVKGHTFKDDMSTFLTSKADSLKGA